MSSPRESFQTGLADLARRQKAAEVEQSRHNERMARLAAAREGKKEEVYRLGTAIVGILQDRGVPFDEEITVGKKEELVPVKGWLGTRTESISIPIERRVWRMEARHVHKKIEDAPWSGRQSVDYVAVRSLAEDGLLYDYSVQHVDQRSHHTNVHPALRLGIVDASVIGSGDFEARMNGLREGLAAFAVSKGIEPSDL